jgi:sporulation protein YlmC with PRC-barrel domain
MTTTTHPKNLSSTSLVGTSVRNPAGEDLGKIEDLMIDLDEGQVAYAVLSFGGFLGMGDKLFAVPFKAFRCDCENETMVLDTPKERLENAPGFDKSNWPDTADRSWGVGIHDHYGVDPYWTMP